ncbi:unnamed protein product, partial [Chrysoparadoxa australica]
RSIAAVSRLWRTIVFSQKIWKDVPWEQASGKINWARFESLGKKNEGTEGLLFKAFDRSTHKMVALKKARVYPGGEGVAYFMLRELCVLQGMSHPNISVPIQVNLHHNKLRLFFEYAACNLSDFLKPASGNTSAAPLCKHTLPLLKQLLEAVAYCHGRGVLHRNLKPKHLLIIPGPNAADPLEGAKLKLSDFALVRVTGYPQRTYTNEVVTLWYRPPEILMGVRSYTSSVDMWSVGCIFAEMVLGRPLFTGISEIDQLFLIFSKLSTPTPETWPRFTELPNFSFAFPDWRDRSVKDIFPSLDEDSLHVLGRLLAYNPDERITAAEVLEHRLFASEAYKTVKREKNDTLEAAAQVAGLASGRIELILKGEEGRLGSKHWSMLVDWLIEVVDVFDMCQRTAFLAVRYVDHFLSRASMTRKNFQLLGATCLHIASKCEDVSYIGVKDLAISADKAYEPNDVLVMEERVLNTLQFRLAVPTVIDFLNVTLELVPSLKELQGGQIKWLANYLAEMSLQDFEQVSKRPSRIAMACLVLALHVSGEEPWPKELRQATNHSLEDLAVVGRQLHEYYLRMLSSDLQVITRRYKKEERKQVANLICPQVISLWP